MASIIQITEKIKQVADRHPLINESLITEEFEREPGSHNYPVMFIVPGPFGYNGDRVYNRILIAVYDLVRENGENRIESYSDTCQVIRDVLIDLKREMFFEMSIEVNHDQEAVKIVDAKEDNAVGYAIELYIYQQDVKNQCEIPE